MTETGNNHILYYESQYRCFVILRSTYTEYKRLDIEKGNDTMRLNEVIDNYGRKYSPYVKGLTNHLPMGQLALYKMCEDIDKVIAYSEMYIKKMDIDEVIVTGDIVTNIDECLSRTKLYGACVDFFKNEIKRDGPEKVIRDTLNNYPHGISSNLYHTIIRLGYAVEGYKIDNSSSDEIARSLSYYITAYKEVKPLKKKVKRKQLQDTNWSSLK